MSTTNAAAFLEAILAFAPDYLPVGRTGFWEGAPLAFMPGHAYEFRDDFVKRIRYSETADSADWLLTVVDGGSASAEAILSKDDSPGGVIRVTTNPADNDVMSLQMNGESFKLATDKALWFETKLAIVDADKVDWFVGLAITDTTILAGTTDSIGFRVPAGDSAQSIIALTEKDSTETTTDTGADVADNTMVRLGFYFNGSSTAKFYVDGELVATHTANIPNDETLTPTIEIRNAGAQANSIDLDYIHVLQVR